MPTLVNRLVCKQAAEPSQGPVAAGLAVVASDTGRVLMLQRPLGSGNDGKWEFPGGRLEEGESPWVAALREWKEETGLEWPENDDTGVGDRSWASDDGKYRGYVAWVPTEASFDLSARDLFSDPDSEIGAVIAWVHPRDLPQHNLRPALLNDVDEVLSKIVKWLTRSVVMKGGKVTSRDISDAIRSVAGGWGRCALDINEGECDQFAEAIIERLGGEREGLRVAQLRAPRGGWHAYIRYQGRAYDAEVPDGVASELQLPFLQRWKVDEATGRWVRRKQLVQNSVATVSRLKTFCSTGEGGGVDPSCGDENAGSRGASGDKKKPDKKNSDKKPDGGSPKDYYLGVPLDTSAEGGVSTNRIPNLPHRFGHDYKTSEQESLDSIQDSDLISDAWDLPEAVQYDFVEDGPGNLKSVEHTDPELNKWGHYVQLVSDGALYGVESLDCKNQIIAAVHGLSEGSAREIYQNIADSQQSRGKYAHSKLLLDRVVQVKDWITIGGGPAQHGGRSEQHHGGTPVEIDSSGKIVTGPAALTGKPLSELDQDKPKNRLGGKRGRTDGQQPGEVGERDEAISSGVAPAPGRSDNEAAGQAGGGSDQPLSGEASQDVPRGGREKRLDAINRLKGHADSFRKNGKNAQADWLDQLREHVKAVGVEAAIESLGEEHGDAGPDRVQYGGAFDELGETAEETTFVKEYLDSCGITVLQPGMSPDPNMPGIWSLPTSEAIETPGGFVPAAEFFEDKLEEAKNLPGLESSEDIDRVVGEKVTQFTPEVVEKLDEKYGKGKWIVKSYGDEAFAGFGIFFPQRAKHIQLNAKSDLYNAKAWLKDYGYKVVKDGEQVIGVRKGEKTVAIGSPEYSDLPKLIQRLGKQARIASKAAGGAVLPMSPEDSVRNDYGIEFRRDADGVPIGITNWTGRDLDFDDPIYKKIEAAEGGACGHAIHRALESDEKKRQGGYNEPKFMVQPAFEAVGVTDYDRAVGATWETAKEGRVHCVTRDGKTSIIPYATLLGRGDSLPAVIQSEDSKAMEKAVQEAIDKLPESKRRGQVYAPDVMKTKDGWRVLELNPSEASGGSAWLGSNPFVIDAMVSHLTGREPQHVKFMRDILRGRDVEVPRTKSYVRKADCEQGQTAAQTSCTPVGDNEGRKPYVERPYSAAQLEMMRRSREQIALDKLRPKPKPKPKPKLPKKPTNRLSKPKKPVQSGYSQAEVNEAMKERQESAYNLSDEQEKLLLEAVKHETYAGDVHRGTAVLPSDAAYRLKAGDTFDPGVLMSWSRSAEVAEEFANDASDLLDDAAPVMFHATGGGNGLDYAAQEGRTTNLHGAGGIYDQQEVLIADKFKVMKVDEVGGIKHVYVEHYKKSFDQEKAYIRKADCERGQRADLTDCTPAEGGGGKASREVPGKVNTVKVGGLRASYSLHAQKRIDGLSIPLQNYQQQDEHSCGFIAALTLSRYFDSGSDAKAVLQAIGPAAAGGVDRKKLVKALRQLGIDAEYTESLTVPKLRSHVERGVPVAVTVWLEDYGTDHWTVVQGFSGDRIHLTNYKSLPVEQFLGQWYTQGLGVVCRPAKKEKAAIQKYAPVNRLKASYFETCDRDDGGRCLPSGEGDAGVEDEYEGEGEEYNVPDNIEDFGEDVIEGLSKMQRKALRKYTGDDYADLNAAMRACPPKYECVEGVERKQMEAIESAVSVRLPEPVTVYRGCDLSEKALQQLLAQVEEVKSNDGSFRMPSITSTTFNPKSGYVNTAGVVFRIQARTGLPVASISQVEDEEEMIQSSRAEYRVVGVERQLYGNARDKVRHVIRLEEQEWLSKE